MQHGPNFEAFLFEILVFRAVRSHLKIKTKIRFRQKVRARTPSSDLMVMNTTTKNDWAFKANSVTM